MPRAFPITKILFVAGFFRRKKLPGFACALLENDIDTPAIRELAGLIRAELGDAGPLFERVLKELGKPLLHSHKDSDAIALHIARLVINDKLSTAYAVYIGHTCYWNISSSLEYRNQNLHAKDLYYENIDCNGHIIGGNRNKIVIEYCHKLLQDQEY